MIRTWAREAFLCCNMRSERMLGLCRQSLGDDTPDAERLCAVSLLAQMLSEHRRLGRNTLKCITRQQLLDAGVPVCAAQAKKKKVAPKLSGSFLAYKEKADAARLAKGVKFTKLQNQECLKSLGRTFALLPSEELEDFKVTQKSRFAQKKVDWEEDKVSQQFPFTRDSGLSKTFVEHAGDRDLPLCEASFRRVVFEELELKPGALDPGFTA
jgi:hypothetical protein